MNEAYKGSLQNELNKYIADNMFLIRSYCSNEDKKHFYEKENEGLFYRDINSLVEKWFAARKITFKEFIISYNFLKKENHCNNILCFFSNSSFNFECYDKDAEEMVKIFLTKFDKKIIASKKKDIKEEGSLWWSSFFYIFLI